MTFTPVHELELLRNGMFQFDGTVVAPGQPNALAALRSELVELRAEFEPGESTEVSFSVRGATITYEPQKQEIVVNGHRAPAPLRGGRQRLTIYADRTGLEVFASDGLTYVPKPFQPKATDLGLSVESKGAPVKFTSLRAYPLKSIWNSTP
jgi:sucrose-6-phosphate hydrolase SacC (GH32 family)